MSARVPSDRARNAGGFGRAVAAGVDPSIVVVSERELAHWAELGHKTQIELQTVQNAIDRAADRKAKSAARSAGWSGTVDGSRAAKLQAHHDRAAAAEARRKILDAEEEALREEVKRQQLAAANAKVLNRDPRLLALNSELLKQQVIAERQEQLQVSARKKQLQSERESHFHDQVLEAVERDTAREEAKAAAAKARAREAALVCQLQLAEIKASKVEERVQQDVMGKVIRAQAEAEAAEHRVKALEARQDAKELAYFRLKQHTENLQNGSPKQTPRQRLDAALASTVNELPEGDAYVQIKQMHYEARQERLQAKADEREHRKALALDAWQSSPRRSPYAPELAPRDINAEFHEREAERVAGMKASKHAFAQSLEAQHARHEATVARLSSDDPERREAVRILAEILEEEDWQARAERRAKAAENEYILRLQAREKAAREVRERVTEVEQGMALIRAAKEEQEQVARLLQERAVQAGLSPLALDRVMKQNAEPPLPSPPKKLLSSVQSPRSYRLGQ